MILGENTEYPVNSYVIARNSPLFKRIIEEEGELDHDVTDFDLAAVMDGN